MPRRRGNRTKRECRKKERGTYLHIGKNRGDFPNGRESRTRKRNQRALQNGKKKGHVAQQRWQDVAKGCPLRKAKLVRDRRLRTSSATQRQTDAHWGARGGAAFRIEETA